MIFIELITKYWSYLADFVVIVAGIIVALSLDNWNQRRKDRILERNLLFGLKEELSLDILDINFNLKVHTTILKNEVALLNLMTSSKKKSSDNVDYDDALGLPLILVLHKTAYHSFQNSPPQIIRNKELKNKILRHYDFFYRGLENFEDEKPNTYTKKLPYFEKHFIIGKSTKQLSLNPQSKDYYSVDFIRQKIEPSNINSIKEDHSFAFILSECIFQRSAGVQMYEDVLARVKKLVIEIESELGIEPTETIPI